jgi:hypothetical protein
MGRKVVHKKSTLQINVNLTNNNTLLKNSALLNKNNFNRQLSTSNMPRLTVLQTLFAHIVGRKFTETRFKTRET